MNKQRGKKKLYQVNTGNRHGQILIFTTKAKAILWLSKVLRQDFLASAINDIIEIDTTWQGFYNIFPSTVK
jgi:hypothetical protein